MKRISVFAALILIGFEAAAGGAKLSKEYIWPKGKMPDAQTERQVAVMRTVQTADGFNPADYREPYLEWFAKPEHPNGCCMILISGGSYNNCCDDKLIERWSEALTQAGCQCVNLVYRTPRPEGLPIYQTAWEDGQRAVRKVRASAVKRGFDPEKIGTVSMSAGSHLAMLLATSSQTRSFRPVDKLDSLDCHINWAIANAPAYVTTDAESGTKATLQGYGPGVELSDVFRFDDRTCPVCLLHGGQDPYSPNGTTLLYREFRRRGIPSEIHLYADKHHQSFDIARGIEFMRQMGFMGELEPEEKLLGRYASDESCADSLTFRQNLWPEGKTPSLQEGQNVPFIEWHFPVNRTTSAIQIIYSGGGYKSNGIDSFEVTPVRRYLNALGMTVVEMKYRCPRPEGMPKHITAWQDLQRAVRLVRSQAAEFGLDPDRIGIMGSSAGGHLTLLGAVSSLQQSYLPIDKADRLSCSVQWAIAVYPAYVLTDGANGHNKNKGNQDSDSLVPELNFDLATCPTLFLHGDADPYSAMGSVKVWEKMRAMGVQSELHTMVLRGHCFQRNASPGTASYNWMDRIRDFLVLKGMDR